MTGWAPSAFKGFIYNGNKNSIEDIHHALNLYKMNTSLSTDFALTAQSTHARTHTQQQPPQHSCAWIVRTVERRVFILTYYFIAGPSSLYNIETSRTKKDKTAVRTAAPRTAAPLSTPVNARH